MMQFPGHESPVALLPSSQVSTGTQVSPTGQSNVLAQTVVVVVLHCPSGRALPQRGLHSANSAPVAGTAMRSVQSTLNSVTHWMQFTKSWSVVIGPRPDTPAHAAPPFGTVRLLQLKTCPMASAGKS